MITNIIEDTYTQLSFFNQDILITLKEQFKENLSVIENAIACENKLRRFKPYTFLFNKFYDPTLNYMITRVAGHISTSHNLGETTNWLTAENIILNGYYFGKKWVFEHGRKTLIVSSYDFLKKENEELPEIDNSILDNQPKQFEHLKKILDILISLPSDKRQNLMMQAFNHNNYERMNQFLGGTIHYEIETNINKLVSRYYKE